MGAPSLLAQILAHPFLACLVLFLTLLATMEAGRRIGRNEDTPGVGAVCGAVFAILGLILAFSFSGAATRFDQRRDLFVREVNAIGTASLRVDLLPADVQPGMRDAFRRYIAARIATDQIVNDEIGYRAAVKAADAISADIWRRAVAAGRRPDALPSANILLLPAIDQMMDMSTLRAFATLMHPPIVIRYMLVGLALVGALLAGIGFSTGQRRAWIHQTAFALIMTGAIFLTIDLEYPGVGFVRVDSFKAAVIDFKLH